MRTMRRSNIHLDILMGRDEELDVSEVFEGTFHAFDYVRIITNVHLGIASN